MSWNPQRLTEAMVLCELSNADLGEELGTVARWRNGFNKGKYEPTLEQIWADMPMGLRCIKNFTKKHKTRC